MACFFSALLPAVGYSSSRHAVESGRISVEGMSDYEASPLGATAAATFSRISPSGAGVMYHAGYRESVEGVRWVGNLQAIWIDAKGFQRESVMANGTPQLRRDAPYIVADTGQHGTVSPVSYRCSVSPSKTAFDPAATPECSPIEAGNPLKVAWDAAELLNTYDDPASASGQRSMLRREYQRGYGTAADKTEGMGQRYIFTFLGNSDPTEVGSDDATFVHGMQMPFVWNEDACAPAPLREKVAMSPLGFCNINTKDGTTYDGNFALLNERSPKLAHRLIDWIRGLEDTDDFRTRSNPAVANARRSTYRLGDIINSTPAIVGAPAESYDLLYGDRSYDIFRRHYRYRRQMIYVGANDGMLHAFNGGFPIAGGSDHSVIASLYRRLPRGLNSGSPRSTSGHDWALGQEAWAFVPGSVLPHLRWLASKKYSHVAYIDGSPLVSDVRLWPQRNGKGCDDDGHIDIDKHGHVCGWGTIMLVPMGLGGAHISVDMAGEAKSFLAGYTLLDITDPEQPPTVLGEITTGSLAAFAPTFALHRESDGQLHFLLVVASGPDAHVGDGLKSVSAQKGTRLGVWVFDLQDIQRGSSRPVAELHGPTDSFAGDMVAADIDLNGSAESVYFGVVSNASATGVADAAYGGGLWKLDLRRGKSDISDPADWRLRPVIDAGLPVVARPAVSMDARGRPRVYVASGRMLTLADVDPHLRQGTQPQYFYGVTDNSLLTGGNTTCQRLPIANTSLFDASHVIVGADGALAENGSGLARSSHDLEAMLAEVRHDGCYAYAGWRAALGASTREVGSPLLLNGQLVATGYRPPANSATWNACRPRWSCGSSHLYVLDYQTGVAGTFGARPLAGSVPVRVEATFTQPESKLTSLGQGMASPPSVYASAPSATTQQLSMCVTPAEALACVRAVQLRALANGEISWREGSAP